MADVEAQRQQANGISLTGAPTFDQDLYGGGDDRYEGYERSIGLAEEQDERAQAVERFVILRPHSKNYSLSKRARSGLYIPFRCLV